MILVMTPSIAIMVDNTCDRTCNIAANFRQKKSIEPIHASYSCIPAHYGDECHPGHSPCSVTKMSLCRREIHFRWKWKCTCALRVWSAPSCVLGKSFRVSSCRWAFIPLAAIEWRHVIWQASRLEWWRDVYYIEAGSRWKLERCVPVLLTNIVHHHSPLNFEDICGRICEIYHDIPRLLHKNA